MPPVISFVIHNYKARNFLKQCLIGFEQMEIPYPHEIIVTEGGSRDGTVELMHERFPHIPFISRDYNTGHAVGNNLGIREAKGKYIWLMNADIIFLDNPVRRIHDFMESHPDVGILLPKLLNPNKTVQTSAFGFYRLLTPGYRRTFLGKTRWGKRDLERFLMSDWDRSTSREVDWGMDSCMVVRKEVFDAIGLMDERFFVYMSDLDLCKRAKEAGFKVYYLADIECIVHYFSRESALTRGFSSLRKKLTLVHNWDYAKLLLKYRKEWRKFIY